MTQATREHIQYLLLQYLEGKATSTENESLADYLTSKENTVVWEDLMEELMMAESAMAGYDPASWQPFIDELQIKNATIPLTPPLTVYRLHFLKRRWWAAAAVFILLAGGAYLFISRPSAKQVAGVTAVSPKEIPPGGNKAMLTLADGTTIPLDSAANGSLAQQGNTRIIKLSNGQLAYNLEGSPQDHPNREQASLGEPSRLATAPERYNTITTPKGGQYQITLSDGTKVWLNAASSIRFPPAFANERNVSITGEVYFEVSSNKKSPFKVNVNSAEIDVLGTRFNINAYADEVTVKTTLLDGSVRVIKGTGSKILSPGQQASWSEANYISLVSNPDLEQIMAWKDGQFIFSGNNIQSVMRQLEKWYDIEVEYSGQITKEEFVGAISRSANLSEILNMLEKTRAVHFEIKGSKVIVR